MPIAPKPMDPEVLTKFMELKKNNNDAYTELLSHILFQEQKEEALLAVIEAVLIFLDNMSPTQFAKDQIQEARNKLFKPGKKP